MPTYKLYTAAGSFRAFPALIAAEYNGTDVSVETDLTKVPSISPSGKAPVLCVGEENVIFGSHAIARYFGTTLQGGGLVDSWMEFCANEIELAACIWFYPVSSQIKSNVFDV